MFDAANRATIDAVSRIRQNRLNDLGQQAAPQPLQDGQPIPQRSNAGIMMNQPAPQDQQQSQPQEQAPALQFQTLRDMRDNPSQQVLSGFANTDNDYGQTGNINKFPNMSKFFQQKQPSSPEVDEFNKKQPKNSLSRMLPDGRVIN